MDENETGSMTSGDHESERRFEQIRPAAIRLSAAEPAASAPAGGRAPRRAGVPRPVWIALAVLGAMAIAVIFLLPGWIATPKPAPSGPVAAPAVMTPVAPPAAPAAAGGAAPYSQALQAQQRKDAQAALERLLELQKALKEIGVESWGAEEFAAAIRLAEEGDARYGTQDFAAAGGKYAEAVAALEDLQAKAEAVHARAMEDGLAAITAGNAVSAAEAFGTALLIRPDDADAAKGLQRAQMLDQVLALVNEGRKLLDAGRLEEAQLSFRKALELDPETAGATTGLEETRARMVDASFRDAMSRGYAALEAGQLETARKAFSEAVQLKPSAADAQGGLRDAQNRIASARIRTLLEEARTLEQAEQWQQAVARYEDALKIDANLLPGQQGRDAAARRAALDARLRQAVARPERLSDRNVRIDTAALIREASVVSDPGPELKKQIAVLTALLAQAETPVRVALQSDGQTEVVIHKVGALGRFTATETTLLPGRYVAVGTRDGFRDVRVEFEVGTTAPPPTVVVQCSEPVAARK